MTKENDKNDETMSIAAASLAPNGKNDIATDLNQTNAGGLTSQINNSNTLITNAPEKTAAQQAEQRRIGSFPSDLSNIKPVFSVKSKNS